MGNSEGAVKPHVCHKCVQFDFIFSIMNVHKKVGEMLPNPWNENGLWATTMLFLAQLRASIMALCVPKHANLEVNLVSRISH